jgi:hypothetical protein
MSALSTVPIERGYPAFFASIDKAKLLGYEPEFSCKKDWRKQSIGIGRTFVSVS